MASTEEIPGAQRVSQEELAHRAEIDRTYISSIERCVYAASVDVVDRLATGSVSKRRICSKGQSRS